AFDNGQRVLRHGIRGRADAAGLALGVAAGAGFAASLAVSRRAGGAVAEAFGKDLSVQDRDVLDRVPDADPAVPLRELANPFRMTRPGVVRRRNLTYGDGSKRMRLDIYSRGGNPGGAPIVLQIHGGGGVTGNR